MNGARTLVREEASTSKPNAHRRTDVNRIPSPNEMVTIA
jgi:hypothetical protein